MQGIPADLFASLPRNAPVVLNVYAPSGDLQSVHYGTLPLQRRDSGRARQTLPKATPGVTQVINWLKEKRAKFKSNRSMASAASVVSTDSRPPPPGILRHRRPPEPLHVDGRRMSAPPMTWDRSGPPPPPASVVGDCGAYGRELANDFELDYWGPQAIYGYADWSLPRAQLRRASADPPMAHRYPPTPPVDYSCSSESELSLDEEPSPGTKVRFADPKAEDIQWIESDSEPEPDSVSSKLEKIYHRFKPAVTGFIASGKKGKKEESQAVVAAPTRQVEANETECALPNGADNVFFLGDTRIDFECREIPGGVEVHFETRRGSGKAIRRRGVITDIEYGPGIVQKLREKFSKMAGTPRSEAARRSPSVDDLLSESDDAARRRRIQYRDANHNDAHKSFPVTESDPSVRLRDDFSPPLPLGDAKTMSAQVLQSGASPRIEETPHESISVLKARFEHQKGERPTAPSIPISKALATGRSQSASVIRLPVEPQVKPSPVISKGVWESKLETQGPKPVRILDLVSPPADPAPKAPQIVSLRQSPLLPQPMQSPTPSSTDSDASPPPEEPHVLQEDDLADDSERPSQAAPSAFEPTPLRSRLTLTLPVGHSTTSQTPFRSQSTGDARLGRPGGTPISSGGRLTIATGDSSGLSEVQKLLTKFNAAREQKISEEEQRPTAVVPPVLQRIESEEIGAKKHIVSISVGESPDEAVPRRSLSTRWLEARGTSDAAGTLDRKGRPYGDDEMVEERRVPETMSVVTEEPEPEEMPVRLLASRRLCEQDTVTRSDFLRNAVLDSSESEPEEEEQEDPLAAYGVHRLGLYEPGTASDGNPVRHSLLNLVAEEDIPALLEAMAEECHFVFDDEPAPTTSGIIHAPAKRAERRRQRRVDRIRFEEKPPGVFAYLDETAAMQEEEWSEGFPISYEQYQRLIDDSQHPSTHDQWRVPVDTSDTGEPEPVVSETPEASSFPFGSARTFQPLQFRQIDAGSSAI